MKMDFDQNINTANALFDELKKRYDDKDLFEEINIYFKSISFFIVYNEFNRALKESADLVDYLVYQLED